MNKIGEITDGVVIYDRYTEYELGKSTITLDRGNPRHIHCRFNVAASLMMKLDRDSGVRFLKIEGDWFVGVTELNRGYKLTYTCNRKNSYKVSCKAVVESFFEELMYADTKMTFRLVATKYEFGGFPVFKIKHNKSLKKES